MQQRTGHGFRANRKQESFVAIKAEQNPPNAGENIVRGNHCGVMSLKTEISVLYCSLQEFHKEGKAVPKTLDGCKIKISS